MNISPLRPIVLQQAAVLQNRPGAKLLGSKDVVLFSGKAERAKALYAALGIDPTKVKFQLPEGVKINETEALYRFAQATEAAQKYCALGNISKNYVAAAVELENGTWDLATNREMSREQTTCAESAAMAGALNKAMEQVSLTKLTDTTDGDAYRNKVREQLKIKTVVVSSDHLGHHKNVCASCDAWFSSTEYFSPNTRFIYARKADDALTLHVERLADRLPFWGKHQPSYTEKPLDSLPVVISERAQQVLTIHERDSEQLTKLIQAAQTQYQQSPGAHLSGKTLASAVLFDDDSVQAASRLDLTRRWFLPADILAHALGKEQSELPIKTQLKAIAKRLWEPIAWLVQGLIRILDFFYGDNEPLSKAKRPVAVAYFGKAEDTPPNETLGILSKHEVGGPDTLLVLAENDQIVVRTIRDYRPLSNPD